MKRYYPQNIKLLLTFLFVRPLVKKCGNFRARVRIRIYMVPAITTTKRLSGKSAKSTVPGRMEGVAISWEYVLCRGKVRLVKADITEIFLKGHKAVKKKEYAFPYEAYVWQ